MDETSAAVTRERVLEAFRKVPPETGISTLGLAWLLGCLEEQRIRAAVSWLAMGGLVERSGMHVRRDRRGRSYRAKLYRWSGRDEIKRVARDEAVRRAEAEMDCQALAAVWLSRRWA